MASSTRSIGSSCSPDCRDPRSRVLVVVERGLNDRKLGPFGVLGRPNVKDRTIASAYSVRASPLGLVSAPVTWVELSDVEMADFTIETMPARFAELGDLHAGIDDAVFSIEPLLEWSERDEVDRGLGDAPYPPNFPKQEGEPPRVQPSRMNKANWADRDRLADSDVVEPQDLS
jgi:hypothetical protein